MTTNSIDYENDRSTLYEQRKEAIYRVSLKRQLRKAGIGGWTADDATGQLEQLLRRYQTLREFIESLTVREIDIGLTYREASDLIDAKLELEKMRRQADKE